MLEIDHALGDHCLTQPEIKTFELTAPCSTTLPSHLLPSYSSLWQHLGRSVLLFNKKELISPFKVRATVPSPICTDLQSTYYLTLLTLSLFGSRYDSSYVPAIYILQSCPGRFPFIFESLPFELFFQHHSSVHLCNHLEPHHPCTELFAHSEVVLNTFGHKVQHKQRHIEIWRSNTSIQLKISFDRSPYQW